MAERTTSIPTAWALLLMSSVCGILLHVTAELTENRIRANEQGFEMKQIEQLAGTMPPAHTGWANDIWNLCNGTLLTRAQAVGYGGPIALLMAISQRKDSGPRLRGIRVLRHQETPGLADFLHAAPEQQGSNNGWLSSLHGRRAAEIAGMDTVTGATISSRAVLQGVLDGLEHAVAAGGECPP